MILLALFYRVIAYRFKLSRKPKRHSMLMMEEFNILMIDYLCLCITITCKKMIIRI